MRGTAECLLLALRRSWQGGGVVVCRVGCELRQARSGHEEAPTSSKAMLAAVRGCSRQPGRLWVWSVPTCSRSSNDAMSIWICRPHAKVASRRGEARRGETRL